MFCKTDFFGETKDRTPILLCANSRVLGVAETTWEKPKEHINDGLNAHGVIKTVL